MKKTTRMTAGKSTKAGRSANTNRALAIRARLLREGQKVVRKLEKMCGPTLGGNAVAQRLGITENQLHSRYMRQRILSFDHGAGPRYPAWQFHGSAVRDWVADLIDLLGQGQPALHWLLVPRTSLKVAGENQSFLTRILANDSDAIVTMLSGARAFAID